MQLSLMKFLVIFLSAGVLALAAPASHQRTKSRSMSLSLVGPVLNDSTTLAKRETNSPAAYTVAEVWVDANMGGNAGLLQLDSVPTCCFNLVGQFVDSISSLEVFPGCSCRFFIDTNCGGDGLTLSGEYAPNLYGTEFQDSLSSGSCDPA